MMKKLLKSLFIFTAIIWATGIYGNHAYADDYEMSGVSCAKKLEKQWFTMTNSKDSEQMVAKKKELQNIMKEFQAFCDVLAQAGLRGEDTFEFHTTYMKDVETFINGTPAFKQRYETLNKQFQQAAAGLEQQRTCEDNPYKCMDAATRKDKKEQMEKAKQNYAETAAAVDECDPNNWAKKWASDINEDDIKKLKKSGKCSAEQIAAFEKAVKEHVQAEKDLYGATQNERLAQNAWHTQENDAAVYDAELAIGPAKIKVGAPIKGDLAEAYKGSEGEAGLETYEKEISAKRGDNSSCSIPNMQQMYQTTCYSCKIIMTLITTFMNACGKVYDLTRDAGVKVLVIGSMLWLAAFALKLVSAFTNQEPMSILHTLFIFMFKVSAAYLVITIGIGAIVNLFVNPLLMAGADYGLGLLQAANQGIIKIATTSSFPYNGTEIISTSVINKIMALTQGIDKTVSTNLVIGHALTCHSFNAGALTYTGELFNVNVTITIPDIWIWLCGAAIWFCGFMLTLGVGYYLLDVCFKIGFCIIALPIVIGLWPFGPTSSKFNSCMSIIFRSAALFAFLALTVSYALSLISASLGDLTTFYAKIKAGDAEWVSNTFSISGASFILIMFAYVYSIKMIGATVSGYVGKFFGDSVFGNASPMHMKATQITSMAKSKVTQAASFAGGVVTHQASRAAGALAGGAVNFVKKQANRGKSSGGGGASGGNSSGGSNPPAAGGSGGSSGSSGGGNNGKSAG